MREPNDTTRLNILLIIPIWGINEWKKYLTTLIVRYCVAEGYTLNVECEETLLTQNQIMNYKTVDMECSPMNYFFVMSFVD